MELYPYQKDCLAALWKFWKEDPQGHPLIVAPTGAGKSLIVAEVIKRVITLKSNYRVFCVCHRKEILEQNAKELQAMLPKEPIGIYSAGLRQKTMRRVTFANIQSIYKKDIPESHLIIIDECHLIPDSSTSMYQKFIKKCQEKNARVKILGLTATPFRLDKGALVGDSSSIFTNIAYDIPLALLIREGYLAPLISRTSTDETDLAGLRKSGYDYNQEDLEKAFDPKTENHVTEIIAKGADRKHWLIFCTSIKHTEHVAQVLNARGIPCHAIHSELLDMERTKRIEEFKAGHVRAICNCEILTTGFNFRPIDMIVLLRATQSCGLYVQICGRGTRTAPEKVNCLVLDFGKNIETHGPIDLVEVKHKNKKIELGIAPAKSCPDCGAWVAIALKVCPSCEYQFPESSCRLEKKASELSIMSAPPAKKEAIVYNWSAGVHNKIGKPPSLKLNYHISFATNMGTSLLDFLCFEHGGYATQMACKKWLERGGKKPCPTTTLEALDRLDELSEPDTVAFIKDGKFDRIVGMTFKKRIDAMEELGINI